MNKRIVLILTALVLLFLATVGLSDDNYGASSNYKLKWKGFSSVGNESSDVSSSSYVLSSSGGQATSVNSDTPSDAESYAVFPGFVKIHHDWRAPEFWIEGYVADFDTVYENFFTFEWNGNDSTSEDGKGWGIWNYDVEYRVADGEWVPWFDATEETSSEFGPADPVVTASGVWYSFRVKAHDKARNFASDWSAPESVFVLTTTYALIVTNDFDVDPFFGDSVYVGGEKIPSGFVTDLAPGSEREISVDSVIIVGDSLKYRFVQWDDGSTDRTRTVTIGEENIFLTAQYDVEYRLLVSNPDGHAEPVPAIGSYWIPEGDEVCFDIEPAVHGEAGEVFASTGYEGSGSLPATSEETSFCFDIYAPSSVEWGWEEIFEACTLYIWAEYGDPEPSGMVVRRPGSEVCVSAPATVLDGLGATHACEGWLGFGSVPSSGLTNDVCFTIEEPVNHIVWQYEEMLRVPFIVSNTAGYGTPVPAVGINWYDLGAPVDAEITPASVGEWFCTGYEGRGDLPEREFTTDPESFFINQPTFLDWLWSNEVVALTVNAPMGSPTPGVGMTVYPFGQEVTIIANAEDTVYDGETRHLVMGWNTIEGSLEDGTVSSYTFNITEDTEIEWVWRTEHHIQLAYRGTGEVVPALSDSGWFVADTVIDLSAEESVGGYAFRYWETEEGANIADTLDNTTTLTVDRPLVIEAVFGDEIWVRIMKDPATEDHGTFIIDGVLVETADTNILWVTGEEHTISASELDLSADGETRWVFNGWVVDGGYEVNPYTIVPMEATTYVASYTTQHLVSFAKMPSVDTYGSLTVDGVVYTDDESTEQEFWFDEGSTHTYEVTELDFVGVGERYAFNSWLESGSTDLGGSTGEIVGPTSFTASYDHQYSVTIDFSPDDPTYGSVTVDGELVAEDVSTFTFWGNDATSYDVLLGDGDFYDDYVWDFQEWFEDGSTDNPRSFIVDGEPIVYTAVYLGIDALITVTLEQYGSTWFVEEGVASDPIEWEIGTVLNAEDTSIVMTDRVKITNTSALNIDLGLVITNVSVVDDIVWTPTSAAGSNEFALRGRFESAGLLPEFRYNDYILDDAVVWANEDRFGDAGENLEPLGEAYLWLKFVPPLWSDVFQPLADPVVNTDERVITAELMIRLDLP